MITVAYRKFPQATLKQFELTASMFPDGATQVWKLPEIPFGEIEVIWTYERESELLRILQLGLLLKSEAKKAKLIVPYLIYARQDKDIANNACFAKATLSHFLQYYQEVEVWDVHSTAWNHVHSNLVNKEPTEFFKKVKEQINKPVTIVYPDHGAYVRYHSDPELQGIPFVVLDKVRDQLTGKITSLVISQITTKSDRVLPDNYLIVDDISDYGGTFLLAAKALMETLKPATISLYVTHFLGHGDINRYWEAGISTIYTSNSLTAYRASKEVITVNPLTKLEIVKP